MLNSQELETRRIVDAICKVAMVEPRDVLGNRRHKSVAMARKVLYWMMRSRLQLSYPEAGKILGRDHTTIVSGCRKVDVALERLDDEICDVIQRATAILDNRKKLSDAPPVGMAKSLKLTEYRIGASQCCYAPAFSRCA